MRLLLGNEALALGALEGGATFFAAYPLPPTSEIDAALLRALPARGGESMLAEDTPAAVAAVLGAGAGGGLGVTSLAGTTLGAAEELLRYGAESRLPALVFVVGSRAQNGSALEGARQEGIARLRIRAPGQPSVPVWAPASAQECFTVARAAAHAARADRTPVLVYVDHAVAHLREPVESEQDRAGAGGSGFEEPVPADLYRARDASIIVVAFGIVARAARTAVRMARDRGLRAGLFRTVRLWPFALAELEEASARARTILVAELNEGQMHEAIAAHPAARDHVIRALAEPDRGTLPPAAILEALEEAS